MLIKSEIVSWYEEQICQNFKQSNRKQNLTKNEDVNCRNLSYINSHIWKRSLDHGKKKDRKTIGAFQRWVWRKILSVP